MNTFAYYKKAWKDWFCFHKWCGDFRHDHYDDYYGYTCTKCLARKDVKKDA